MSARSPLVHQCGFEPLTAASRFDLLFGLQLVRRLIEAGLAADWMAKG